MLLMLFSCKENSSANTNQPLVIWQSYNNEESKVFQKIVERYEATHPGEKIRSERVPFDGLLPKLITAAIAHKTPDIARVDLGHIARLAWGKAILPLDEFGAARTLQTLHRAARPAVSVRVAGGEAKIFALPDQLTTVALYYNKDLLHEAGLKVPATLAELAAAGAAFRGKKMEGFALGLDASLWWAMPWLYAYNAQILSEDLRECRLADVPAREAVTYLRSLYATHKTEGGAWIAGSINPSQGFVSGRYAMVLSGPWNLKAFRSVNFGVSLVPGREPGQSASNLGGSAMVVFRGSKKTAAAWRFLDYLVSEEAQQIWTRETGQLSVNLKVNRERERQLSPELKTFMRQLDFAGPRPQMPGYDTLEQIVIPYLYAALDGSLPVDLALQKACREIDSEILVQLRKAP